MIDDDPYLIPGTKVLRNKVGATDQTTLDYRERESVSQRIAEGTPSGDFDLAHAKAIHRHLFQDVYQWAGQVRTLEISKDGHQFQPRGYIETGMADVHRRVRKANYLRGMDVKGFGAKAGEIIGDVNYAHPFREGNGRTQLEYLRQLGERAGHPLDPGQLDRDRWIAASIASHSGNYGPMASAIEEQVLLARDLRRAEQLIESDRNAKAQMRVLDTVTAKALSNNPDAAKRVLAAGRDELAVMTEQGKPIPPPDLKSPEPEMDR